MMRLRPILAFILILTLSPAGYPDEAKTAYKKGVRAESEKQYDTAYESFKHAYTLKPNDAQYQLAYLRARASAAAQHVANGLKLRNDKNLQEALAEFQRGAEIDSTNYVAAQEMRRTEEMIKKQSEPAGEVAANRESPLAKLVAGAQGPVEIEPSPDTPITLRIAGQPADYIYRAIGKLGGINVLFDLDYRPQKITIELNEVMFRDALKMVALESKTFWRPISRNAIFVAAEGKRKEYEPNVMKTFYLRNASTPAELQDVVGALKGLLDINHVQVNPTHSSLTLRGTTDQLVLAEKLISDTDKPKGEVVLDVAVMEINRDHLNTLGTVVPTKTDLTPVPTGKTGSGSVAIGIGSLNGTSWAVPIPGASFSLVMNDSSGKVLQRPQLRALDNAHAILKVGDRIPIATGSFSAGFGASGGTGVPLTNTQFTYVDVGVNIDITPHIHSDHEVTLKMVLEVTSLNGQSDLGGVIQPKIGQRRIEHETRLQDGEVNLIGGILQDTETKSLSGYPWLTKIPILKYLFGQESKERIQNEVVFAITPHIVRAEDVTDENLRMIDVGTNSTIGLRYNESKPAKPKESPSPAAPATPASSKPSGRTNR